MKKPIIIAIDKILAETEDCQSSYFLPAPRRGALDFLKNISTEFNVYIYSIMPEPMVETWIINNGFDEYIVSITDEIPPDFIQITPDNIEFNGNYTLLYSFIEKAAKNH